MDGMLISERIRSTCLARSISRSFATAARLMHHQRVQTRLAKRPLHDLAHHRGIVHDQGSHFAHAQTPLAFPLSALSPRLLSPMPDGPSALATRPTALLDFSDRTNQIPHPIRVRARASRPHSQPHAQPETVMDPHQPRAALGRCTLHRTGQSMRAAASCETASIEFDRGETCARASARAPAGNEDSAHHPLSTRNRSCVRRPAPARIEALLKAEIKQPSRRRRGAAEHRKHRQTSAASPRSASTRFECSRAAPGSSTAAPVRGSPGLRRERCAPSANGPTRPAPAALCASSAGATGRRDPSLFEQQTAPTERGADGPRGSFPARSFARDRRREAGLGAGREHVHPPSKTGAERLRQRCSQPERHPGLRTRLEQSGAE